MSLTDSAGAARRLADQACAAIDDLAAVAGELDAGPQADLLAKASGRLRDESFRLMLLGRFDNGKSTLVNALIGRLDERAAGFGHDLEMGIVPMGEAATTPMLITIEYADDPFVKTIDLGGNETLWTLEKFREEFVLDSDEEANQRRFGEVESCRIGVPAQLCEQRVVLFDTPGVTESPGRDDLARSALVSCDAALVMYSLNHPYGHDELAYEGYARQDGVKVITVVNTFGKEVTDTKRRHAWNKLVLPRTGEKFDGQDLAARDIFFVDAKQALTGRAERDETVVARSGLAALEQRLGAFLLRERHHQHITRHLRAAETQVVALHRILSKRMVTADGAMVDLARALAGLEPELARIREGADRVPGYVRQARQGATVEVRDSFTRLMLEIERQMPRALARAPLPSWHDGIMGLANAFRQKKLGTELAAAAREHAEQRISAWRETARGLVAEHMERAAHRTNAELTAMEVAYDRAYGAFTGWTPAEVPGSRPRSSAERWGTGFLGTLLAGGPVGAVAAGGGGKRAVIAGLGAQIGTGVALGLLGVTAPVAIPIVAVAGFLAAIAGGRISRKELVDAFVAHSMPHLLDQFQEFTGELELEVAALFERFGDELNAQATALVRAEELNFQRAAESSRANQMTRQQEITMLRLLQERVFTAQSTLDLVRGAAAYELLDES